MCSWNLPGPDNYALQYADGVQTYITESVSHIYRQINTNTYLHKGNQSGRYQSTSWFSPSDVSVLTGIFEISFAIYNQWITTWVFPSSLKVHWMTWLRVKPRSLNIITAIKNECETDFEKAKDKKRERKREKQLEVHSAGVRWPLEKVATEGPSPLWAEHRAAEPITMPSDSQRNFFFCNK